MQPLRIKQSTLSKWNDRNNFIAPEMTTCAQFLVKKTSHFIDFQKSGIKCSIKCNWKNI